MDVAGVHFDAESISASSLPSVLLLTEVLKHIRPGCRCMLSHVIGHSGKWAATEMDFRKLICRMRVHHSS